MKPSAIVLDSGDADELSDFYRRLLNWKRSVQVFEEDRWFVVTDPAGKGLPLVFQQCDDYRPPAWPNEPDRQQAMVHLDFYLKPEEIAGTVDLALACGARLATTQYSESWRVLIDPAGHPFCLIPVPPEFAAAAD